MTSSKCSLKAEGVKVHRFNLGRLVGGGGVTNTVFSLGSRKRSPSSYLEELGEAGCEGEKGGLWGYVQVL